MRNDIDAVQRQHHLGIGAEPVEVRGAIRVDAGGEGVQISAKLRRLLLIPLAGALVDTVGGYPAVGIGPGLAPVLGPAAACLAVEMQNHIAVALRLRPPEAVEDAGLIVGKDVRDAEGIPQNYAMRRRGGGERRQRRGEKK